MNAQIASLTVLLFSSNASGQDPETFTDYGGVYTKGNLICETRFDFVDGERLWKEKGRNEITMRVPDVGVDYRPVILVVSGVGKTTDGREFDFVWLDSKLRHFGIYVRFFFHDSADSNPLNYTRPYSPGHSYAYLGRQRLNQQPIRFWQANREGRELDKLFYLASGSFTIGIYEAVTGKKLTLEMVDARAFNDPTQNVSQGPKDGFPIASVSDWQLKSFATGQPVVSRVAADGVTLLLLRTEVPEPGSVIFQLDGGGSLYLLTRDPFVAAGASSTQARSRSVAMPSGPRNYAFALYRPPPMVPEDGNCNFTIRGNFKPNVETAQVISGEASGTLVRPPVVLVHGTYDNPRECWMTKDADDAPQTMYESLTAAGFRVFCVDWERTNGREDPSDFSTNALTVYQEKEGIRDALEAFRKEGIAVTQADVVAHSQGGVITRVFARGRPLTRSISITDPHCGDTQACREHGCWYHTKRNFGQGDIRRFITISSTHRGSDIPGLFRGIVAVQGKSPAGGATAIWFANFIDGMQYWMTGVKTGGFKDQMPGSEALRDIGPTPIKSHAIAIVCSDQIMETRKSAFYLGRLKKLWTAIPRHLIEPVFDAIGQRADGEKLHASAKKYADLGLLADWNEPYRDLLREFRQTVFRGEENDCVVALSSSCGGLSGRHLSKIEGYVHSYSPRETEVQMRVLALLRGSEDPFDPRGFPDTYATEVAAGTADTTTPAIDNPPTPIRDGSNKPMPQGAQDTLKKAQDLINQGKLADAEYLVSEAVDENPKVAELWIAKSSLLVSLRRIDGAIYAAQQAIDLEPQNADYRASLGMAFFAKSDHQEAVEAYRESVRLAPKNGYYHGALGAGLIGLQRYKEAETPLSKALELAPSFALHHLYMGDCLSFQSRWAEALPFYQDCVRLDPKQAGGHAGIGGAAAVQGRFAEAELELRKAVELAPYVAQYQANLAGALLRQGKKTEAIRLAQEAKRLGLQSHWVYQELGLPPD
jgi:tetratricopeptide (TPR) repeat protein/pimeloyl-ACP methyl ester carboxylesterase